MPTNNSESLVLLSNQNGWALIPRDTPLTRLNYFDGKFLRAADLKAEQDYLRHLVELSNQTGGPGVAHGFDLKLGGGDALNVGPGLAVDPKGRVLLLTVGASVNLQQLIEQSRNQDLVSKSAAKASSNGDKFSECETASVTPPTNALLPGDLYLITVAHAEGYCGEEDVYGKLCEEACSTGTDRPFIIEGLVLRALPLQLTTLPATSNAVALTQTHRRSLVASAYFADERLYLAHAPSLISGAGLKSDIWCFGAEGASGDEVPLGVVARAGQATLFLDVWTARRERIDAPAKRYWQWRMAMRPWDVALAQILQFQCQLRDMFQTAPVVPLVPGPCDNAHQLVAAASDALAEITKIYEAISGRLTEFDGAKTIVPYTGGVAGLNMLQQKLQAAKEAHLLVPSNRLLINGGIVELPFAGYLPVAPSETLSVNEQVRLMLGEGVDLRFCVVRPDYVAHALEEAQHMERISLLEGLDNPQKKPEVDILVPDGEIVDEKQDARGYFEAQASLFPHHELVNQHASTLGVQTSPEMSVPLVGVARGENQAGGGRAVYMSLLLDKKKLPQVNTIENSTADTVPAEAALSGSQAKPAGGQQAPTESGASVKGTNATEEATSGSVLSLDGLEAGVWLTMRCDKDPEKIKAGQTFQVEGRVIAGLTFTRPGAPAVTGYVNGFSHADVLVDGVTSGAGKTTVACRVSAVVQATMKGTGSGNPKVLEVKFNAEFSWGKLGGAGEGFEIVVFSPDGRGEYRFGAEWDGGLQRDIETKVGYLAKGDQKENDPVEAGFLSNPDVLKADNERHMQALKALQVIGSALGDSAFVDTASSQLFPPPETLPAELIVRGTRDWVLFHRRRTKRCKAEQPAPPPAPNRRYQVYHTLLEDVALLKLLREALKRGDATLLKRFELKPVTVVEFGANVAQLASNPQNVKADWVAAKTGDLLIYAAVASQSGVEGGDTLATQRLNRTEDAVATVSHADAQTVTEMLPSVPPSLAAPGTDGVIVMATTQEIQQTCHTAYRVHDEAISSIAEEIRRGGLESLMKSFDPSLGSVTFTSGQTADPASLKAVVEEWAKRGGGDSARVAVAFEGEPASSADVDIQSQAQTINQALGGSADIQQFTFAPTHLPQGSCPAISFFGVPDNPLTGKP